MALRKQAPASDTVVEVEFTLSDPIYPSVAASELEGCRFELEEITPRGDGCYAEFYSIEGADPDRILELADEHEDSEGQFLSRNEDGGLLELVVTDTCPALYLAEQGALPRQVDCGDGELRIVAEIPPQYEAPEIIARFLDAHDDAELVAQRQQSYYTPLFSHREFEEAIEECLTERQHEVLRAAHEGGYYEWPRDATAEELAEDLGITAATFSQHLRAAEQKLIRIVFESRGRADAGPGAETAP